MKHILALSITALLSVGAAQTSADPALSSTPVSTAAQAQSGDPTLSQAAITIETGRYQGPLSSLLGAIAQAAGYELVLEVNVDTLAAGAEGAKPVAYSFRDKPFNEVWPLLMDVYGLNYSVSTLGGQPVIRVSNAAVQRVVDLQAADADYVVERAKVFFGSPAAAQGQPAQAAGQDAGQQSPAAQQYQFDSPTLRVIADTTTNRVIIRGNNQEVREVEKFVRDIDASANARRQEQEAQYGANAGATKRTIYTANSDAAQLLPFISAQYPGLRFSAVPGGRSLVIQGNAAATEEALAFLREVDPAAGETTQRVFQLVNADATELKNVLTGILAANLSSGTGAGNGTGTSGTGTGSTGTGGTGSTNNTGNAGTPAGSVNVNVGTTAGSSNAPASQAGMATILPDRRTNTLIVRGTPAQVAQVAELIPSLDRKVPQISLQVRIQEINESARRSLGVDWQARAGGFTVGLLGTGANAGLSASFDPTRSVMGFNIFPALRALETQSLAKRVYDGKVTMQSGQGPRKSTAPRTVNGASEAAAYINAGGNLTINIPIVDENGNSMFQKQEIKYGVYMDFFNPTVAPDGTINVEVAGMFANVRNQAVIDEAGSRGTVPTVVDLFQNEAQTKISFKPGETVLLAGLTNLTESSSNSGLPYLSQIPVLGALAGSQATTREEVEMLFVITGNIVE